ncbi:MULTISPECIES: phage tail protein I [unclassified Halomonas]|uniref:phage tail protein I n=1 Tax=unclassified Halomonas TaxID=2609666 RepID=UPI002883E1F5|nr:MULTISPECIES: phage tail protein I [unclassified Halomonas]MDT0501907.1 phage tail protein I [Halomonas sp. PAR7]MDT0511004.1 phage tail protein I [Halomonas sp. LES1]MDT0592479.1 phage tail protein I [Halomonas sp. PAR8]
MSELLPPNAAALERAVAEAAGELGSVPVVVREVWNPDTCPPQVLPWLAWAFSVDDWDEAWSDAQKRDSIHVAIAVQRHKGTIGSVKDALGALGIEARVQEWFNQTPAGAPYTFKLWLESNQTPVTQTGIAQVLEIAERLKSLRSHLDEILVRATSQSRVTAASGANLGTEITVGYRYAAVVLNAQAIVLANDRPGPILANAHTIILE